MQDYLQLITMILSRGLIKTTKAEKFSVKYSYSLKVCILIRGYMVMEVLLKTVNPFPVRHPKCTGCISSCSLMCILDGFSA